MKFGIGGTEKCLRAFMPYVGIEPSFLIPLSHLVNLLRGSDIGNVHLIWADPNNRAWRTMS